jgi:putative transposase
MIAAALEAEVGEYVERFADERHEDGRRLVVRNGCARERKVTVGSGTVAIQAPRVNDRRVDPESGEPALQLADSARLRAPIAEGR